MEAKIYSGPSENIFDEIVVLYSKSRPAWEEIITKCKQGLELDPGFFPAYYYLGHYEKEKENYDKMMEHFLIALELAKRPHNPITWDNIMWILEDELADYERVAIYRDKFYQKQPHFFVLKHCIRVLWRMLNRRNEAIALLDQYVQNNPEDRRAERLRRRIIKRGDKSYVRIKN